MADFKMDLTGVKPASVNSYVDPGTYPARVDSADVETDGKYGNAVRFTFIITGAETTGAKNSDGDPVGTSNQGSRISTLMAIPDDTMAEACAALVKSGEKKAKWDENFMSMMASKWVSLINASGLKAGKVDARKLAQKLVGSQMLILVEDSKRNKPTDSVFANVNGTMPLPVKAGRAETDDDLPFDEGGSDDSDDEFDLDSLD